MCLCLHDNVDLFKRTCAECYTRADIHMIAAAVCSGYSPRMPNTTCTCMCVCSDLYWHRCEPDRGEFIKRSVQLLLTKYAKDLDLAGVWFL